MNIKNKNYMKKVLGALFLATLMASCSDSDNHITDEVPNNEIRLMSTVNFTKSEYDTQLNKDSKVGFYVTEWQDATTPGSLLTKNLYENVLLTALGNGKFEYGNKMYYPLSGNKVDFYTYHPYQSSKPSDLTAIPFTIKADQTDLTNYLASDLLWAKKTGVARTNLVIPIEFRHTLSKLEFVVKKGEGVDLKNLNKVEVLEVASETSLDLEKGSITQAKGTPVDVIALGIKPTTEAILEGGEAIIIPQTIAKDKKLLRISLGDVTFSYTPSDVTTFEPGKKYIYTITVNMGDIEVSSTIKDWDKGETIDEDGIMD